MLENGLYCLSQTVENAREDRSFRRKVYRRNLSSEPILGLRKSHMRINKAPLIANQPAFGFFRGDHGIQKEPLDYFRPGPNPIPSLRDRHGFPPRYCKFAGLGEDELVSICQRRGRRRTWLRCARLEDRDGVGVGDQKDRYARQGAEISQPMACEKKRWTANSLTVDLLSLRPFLSA